MSISDLLPSPSDDLEALVRPGLDETLLSLDDLIHVITVGLRGELGAKRLVGRALGLAKAKLGHGQWGPWLAEHFDLTQSSANDYMLIDREWERVIAAEPTVSSMRGFMRVLDRLEGKQPRPPRTPRAVPAPENLGSAQNMPDPVPEPTVIDLAAAPAPEVPDMPEPAPEPEVVGAGDETPGSARAKTRARTLAQCDAVLGRMERDLEHLAEDRELLVEQAYEHTMATARRVGRGLLNLANAMVTQRGQRRPRCTPSRGLPGALVHDFWGNRGLWTMSGEWSAKQKVEYMMYGLAALQRLGAEGCTAQNIEDVLEINRASWVLHDAALLHELADQESLGQEVSKEVVALSMQMLDPADQAWVVRQVPQEQPSPQPEQPSATPKPKRRRKRVVHHQMGE